jgi:hypothetical protein
VIDLSTPGIERSLKRLAPLSAPPGLGERVIGAALEARKNAALTPRQRMMAVACMVLLVAVGFADAVFSRSQAKQLMSLRDGRGAAAKPEGDLRPLLGDILGGIGRSEQTGLEKRILARMDIREEPSTDRREIRARLKGWIEHEDSENFR